jgi:hypothetical protein
MTPAALDLNPVTVWSGFRVGGPFQEDGLLLRLAVADRPEFISSSIGQHPFNASPLFHIPLGVYLDLDRLTRLDGLDSQDLLSLVQDRAPMLPLAHGSLLCPQRKTCQSQAE